MSRSQPTLTNPSQHFFSWSGSRGQLEWYDKDNQKNVPVKIPFTFLVLDELATIVGYDDQAGTGYYSNEVRSVAREEFHVKAKGGTREVGLYANLKVRAKGAKYAKSIYIAHQINGEWVIGNIKASGAALTAWIELGQKHQLGNGKISLTGSTEATKGATKYQVPTFEWSNSETEEDTEAVKLDKELQIYLSHYFAMQHTVQEEIPSDVDQSVGLATPEQQASYVKPTRSQVERDPVTTYQEIAGNEQGIPDYNPDEPINLNDIPF